MNLKAYLAELIGTFTLVLVGCGAAIIGNPGLLGTALAFGLAVTAMAYAVGGVSGGHFNPAVSLAMTLTKRLSWKDFGLYVLSQLLGALLACVILLVFNQVPSLNGQFASNTIIFAASPDNYDYLYAVIIEVIVTFLFIFVIIRTTSNPANSKVAGLIIGLTLAILIMLSGNLTNASLNPARSLLPALFEGGKALEQVWIFIVGPLLGGTLAAITAPFFEDKKV